MKTISRATNLAYHILNTVDIPCGTIREEKEDSDKKDSDYTQYVTVYDLAQRIYSIRLYDSPLVYSIDLSKLDLERLNGVQKEIPKNKLSIDIIEEIDDLPTANSGSKLISQQF